MPARPPHKNIDAYKNPKPKSQIIFDSPKDPVVEAPKPERCLIHQLPENLNIEIRYAELRLTFERVNGLYARCRIIEGKSAGKNFSLSANTPVVKRGTHYEVEI